MRVERPRGLAVLRRCLLGLFVPLLLAGTPVTRAADATVHPGLWPERPGAAPSPATDAFVNALLARMPELHVSISYTTRNKRPTE